MNAIGTETSPPLPPQDTDNRIQQSSSPSPPPVPHQPIHTSPVEISIIDTSSSSASASQMSPTLEQQSQNRLHTSEAAMTRLLKKLSHNIRNFNKVYYLYPIYIICYV